MTTFNDEPSPYLDHAQRDRPARRTYKGDFSYIGNLQVGALVVDSSGREMEIIAQYEGSTTVTRVLPASEFKTWEGEVVKIENKKETVSIARGTAVKLRGAA